MKFLLSLMMFAATCTAFAQGTSEAILSYYANDTSGVVSSTAGWTFQPTNGFLTVTSLGCFANVFVNNPTANAIEVGLWAPDGSLLASNSITPSSTLSDQTRYESITPVVLDPGQLYHVGVFYLGGSLGLDVASPSTGGSVSNSLPIQLDGAVHSTSGFTSPTVQDGPAGSIYVGPNFEYQGGGVPEPSAGLLLGLGGVLLAARRRNQRL
jgi:hypothetical protein